MESFSGRNKKNLIFLVVFICFKTELFFFLITGQVATVIREHNCGSKITQYIRIPSNCNCGITLFVLSENSTLCKEIEDACELPAMY